MCLREGERERWRQKYRKREKKTGREDREGMREGERRGGGREKVPKSSLRGGPVAPAGLEAKPGTKD